jgi:hypothetical protein
MAEASVARWVVGKVRKGAQISVRHMVVENDASGVLKAQLFLTCLSMPMAPLEAPPCVISLQGGKLVCVLHTVPLCRI